MDGSNATGQPAGTAPPGSFNARVNAMHTQAAELEARGAWDQALPIREEIARLIEARYGKEHSDTDTAWWDLANTLRNLGQYASEREVLQRCLAARIKVLGQTQPAVIKTLARIGDSYLCEGQAEPALRTIQGARTQLETGGTNTLLLANVLTKEMVMLRILQRSDEASQVYPDSIRRLAALRGVDDPEVLLLRRNHALVLASEGDHALAQTIILEVRGRLQTTGRTNEPTYLTLLSDLGDRQQDLGDLPGARQTFESALAAWVARYGGDNPMACGLKERIALLALDSGNLEHAQQLLTEALATSRRIAAAQPARSPELASSLLDWVKFDRALGRWDEAERHVNEAWNLQVRSLGRNHLAVAETMEQAALLAESRGEPSKACELHREALRIRRAASGDDDLLVARSRNNLASALARINRLPEAVQESQKAFATMERVAGPASLHTAQAAFIVATVRHRNGDLDQAARMYDRALTGLTENRSRHEAVAARDASFLELDRGRYQPALDLAARSLKMQEDLWWNVLRFGSETDRLAWRGFADLLSLLGTLASRDSAPLATAILRFKGAVLDSLAEDRQLAMAGGAGVSPDVGALQQARRERYRLELAAYSRTPPTAAGLQAARQRVESLESSLGRQFAALGEGRRAFTANAEAVRQKLPTDTVLVEYVRYRHWLGKGQVEPRFGALLFHTTAPLRWIDLGPAEGPAGISGLVTNLHSTIRHQTNLSTASLQPILQSLHDRVWAKVHEALPPGIRWVIVAPDAEVCFIPFAALWRTNRFLGQDLFFRYVTSARDVLTPADPASAKRAVDLWADPEFARPAWKRALDMAANTTALWMVKALRGGRTDELSGSYAALPRSRLEAQALARIVRDQRLGEASLFVGAEASEARLRQRPAPHVLHLATHGSFLPDAPEQPYQTIASGPPQLEVLRNPMTRAWLTLARANETLEAWRQGTPPDPADDGLLTADEIAGMDLRGTWLVTLSACDTGIGAARTAEGVFGLRRAFALAGARHVLLTLWPVSDLKSRKFMEAFYTDALKTGDAPGALARQQRIALAAGTGGGFFTDAVRYAGVYVLNSTGL